MKFSKIIYISLGAVVTACMVSSCVKSGVPPLIGHADDDFSNKARVQIYNAAMGTTRNYVYADGVPLSGASFAFPSTFPSTPANFAVTAGLREFVIKDTAAVTTQPQMAFGENLQANKFYTIFMYDTINVIKHKTVENTIVIPADTTARIRFANFAYLPGNAPALDLFSKNQNAVVIPNISGTQVSDFISYQSNKADTFYLRLAGTGTFLQNRTNSTATPPVTTFANVQLIFNPTNKRSYTIIFRGSYRSDLTNTATTNLRTMSAFSNY